MIIGLKSCESHKYWQFKMTTNVDYEFVGKLQDELICSICMKVLNEPQMVNCCEQRFCKNCLTEWMTNNKTCPHCRSTDFNHILLKRLSKRISELEVYCANKAHGCKSTLEVSEYQHHLSVNNPQGCFFTKLLCPLRCGADLFRGDLGNHCKEKCPKRRVQCQYCKSKGEYQIITGGHTDTCPCYPLACPQSCGAEVLRKDLTAHQGVCPMEPVACPFSDIGCKVKVPRRDLDKHIQSSMFQHMTDMAKSHTALKEEHEALKKDHRVLKEDYKALKESNKAKMNATELFLKDRNSDQAASTITVAQLYTLLVDTSTMEIGSTFSLALNIKSGHHYIILEGYKFKLKWQEQQGRQQPLGRQQPPGQQQPPGPLGWQPPPGVLGWKQSRKWQQPAGGWQKPRGENQQLVPSQRQQIQYIVRLYSVTDAAYPLLSKDWRCRFEISLNSSDPQTICISNGTPEGGAARRSVGGDDQLFGSVTLDCGSNITAPILHIQT